MLVKGATPLEMIRQYMAKGDSPTRGRELNIHFGDIECADFIGQISHLGDMVPVMAGVTLSFKMRREARVGLVYVGDGATSTGAFHEGINFAAVQRCPLVVIVENNGYAYSTPTSRQTRLCSLKDKATGYGVPGVRADGNDVVATYQVTKDAVDRARRGRRSHADRADDLPPQGSRGARQPVVRARRRNRPLGPGERSARPVRHAAHRGRGRRRRPSWHGIDARVTAEIDQATDSRRTVAAAGAARRPHGRLCRSRRACRRSGTVRASAGRWTRTSGRPAGEPTMAESDLSRGESGRRCSRRWSATPTSSAWARTSAPTVGPSR